MLLEETEGVAPAASNRTRTFPAKRHKKRQKDRRPGRCACPVMLYKNKRYFLLKTENFCAKQWFSLQIYAKNAMLMAEKGRNGGPAPAEAL